MSQVETIVVEATSEKSGVNAKGKPWQRYALTDGNNWYSTFEAGVVKPEFKGQAIEIEWEPDGDFKKLLRASPATGAPPLGTGEYIKGKEAPETQRNIRASVALENAVAWCIGNDESRATLSEHGVVLVAKVFYKGLQEMAEGKEPGTPATSPSSDGAELPI